MLNSVDALALEDLKNGANGFCNAYRRATMGETKLGQFALFLGQPDTQNAFFGMFSGFAGVAESGQRVGKVEPEMYARVTEPGARSEQIATLVISASRNPALAENIRHAQMAGHPDVLTYGGNIAANRDAALEIVPRLPGFTRDEYPFASTLEGGGGSWVGHIPSSQNSSQGGILKNFYQQNNIQPGMRFRVIIGE